MWATSILLFMNNSGWKFEIPSLYTSFCIVRLVYTFWVNVLKVPVWDMFKMTENIVLMSYSDVSYLVISQGGYVKKHSNDIAWEVETTGWSTICLIMTWLSCHLEGSNYTMTLKNMSATVDAFLVWLPLNYCDLLHHAVLHSSGILHV